MLWLFWFSALLIAYILGGYPILLWTLARVNGTSAVLPIGPGEGIAADTGSQRGQVPQKKTGVSAESGLSTGTA